MLPTLERLLAALQKFAARFLQPRRLSDPDSRDALDQFCVQKLDVEGLAATFPSCACELAKSPTGSPGPVVTGEVVRLYLTSPTHLRVKKADDLAKRKFRAADLKRAYEVGLSVCRLSHASREEQEFTARNLHDIQVAANGEVGGLVGTVDFPVEAVRECPLGTTQMCVHETPLDPLPEGGYRRGSHADVVNSRSGMTPEEQKASRDVLFNQIVAQGKILDASAVTEFDLVALLPRTAI